MNVGGALTGGAALQIGPWPAMVAIADDGLPGWYPSPATTTRVTEPMRGTALNEAVTVAFDEPAGNVTDVGEIVIPEPLSAVHEIDTVNAADVSPVRVRLNAGGVSKNGAKSAEQPDVVMIPSWVVLTTTDRGACCAVTGAVSSSHAPTKTPTNTPPRTTKNVTQISRGARQGPR